MFAIDNLIEDAKDLVILYVEDNEDARKSTLLILEDIFDNIIVAVDGQDGLEKFKNNKVDFIITDITMPNMDGLEMSKAIKLINEDMPILILSAVTDISIFKEAIDISIDSFVNKPLIDINIVFNKLHQIIKKLKYEKTQKELEDVKIEKDKAILVLEMLNEIAHQWRQPLSVITTISSGYIFKKEHGMQSDCDDIEMAHLVEQTAQKLSNLIDGICTVNIEDINIDKLEKMIKISNPLYKRH